MPPTRCLPLIATENILHLNRPKDKIVQDAQYLRPTFNLPEQFYFIGGGTKNGVALPPAFLPPRDFDLSTGGGIKVGMLTAFGGALMLLESGGGVNIGGESFPLEEEA